MRTADLDSYPSRARARGCRCGCSCLLVLTLAGWAGQSRASLPAYDAAITNDLAAGLAPTARLTEAVVLTGANRASFNFGVNSGDVTMEFILEGDPVGGGLDGYLAVGANTTSNLRYEQWSDTGQMGFTQLGVLDYLFSPVVPSPTDPVHVAYVWNAATRTMSLYWNGSVAGTRSAVDPGFAMPNGEGYLGANPGNTENMLGTIHRVTVYDEILPDDAIQRHADAFNGVLRPPIITLFAATPEVIFTPNSTTLGWTVVNADAVFLDGTDVTSINSLTVSPTATTTYTLTATNASGSATATATVQVDPAPFIHAFTVSRAYVGVGESVTLHWDTSYGDTFSIMPGVGDVSAQATNGAGSVAVEITGSTTYTLTVGNSFGATFREVEIHVVQPADHLVISEFMADDETVLADEDGQHTGWIEIYNPTAAAVNLAGYYLTDDADDPTQWAFPDLELEAGGYLVVFASGKDRNDPLTPLHTNFRLNNGGEYLALAGPGPQLLHAYAPAYPNQRADLSYGILGGDPGTARYLGVPTPGAANDETVPPPARVSFSRPDGFFAEGFELVLATATPDADIRYTLDGSLPGPDQGLTYTAPIAITGTTRVRAVASIEGRISRMAEANYVKLAPDLAQYTSSLPILVIENFGAGVIPQKGWSGTGAGIRQVPRQPAVWATFDRMGGFSSLSNAPQMFSAIGIRGRGAFSTQWRQKPYSVEAWDDAGEEKAVSPLGLPAHSDWVLYFPDPDDNKDPTLLFNTFVYELSGNTGRYSVRFRWVEAFVNEDGGDLSLADRRGVYAIIEKVSRGPDRLDFEKLSEDGSRGGWLLDLNRMDAEPETGWPAPNGATQPWFFHTAGPNRIQETPPNTPGVGDDIPRQSNGYLNFDNPGGYSINSAQRAAIENWFQQFEDVLYNDGLWRDPVNGYRRYLDDLDFVDYFILNVLTRNGDGLLISMFPWKGDDGKLRMGPAWDYNWSAYYISGTDPTGTLLHRSDRLWYPRLFSDPDFVQRYIDRWWDLRRGPMSNAAMEAIIDGQAAEITPEKALLNGLPSASEWAARLGQMKDWLTGRADWIDGNYLAPPLFNQDGGPVPDGFQLVILGTNGTLYVTTDGSDPRAPGGAVATGAQAYAGPVPINSQTLVQARIKNGANWSGLTAAVFYPPQDLTKLALTEIMFHPPAAGLWGSEDLEFLELKNTGSQTLNLGTLAFTDGIQFTFTNGTRLEPGRFFVLVRNAAAFQSQHPAVTVNGIYAGKLDNGGERLQLSSPYGGTVLSVTYNDRAPWPIAADGYGFSAVPLVANPLDNSDDGSRWRASSAAGGSPGADDPEPGIPPVLINEILTHTDPPALDAVELFNSSATDADIGGWFLSDDGAVPKKFRIPDGAILPAGEFAVFTEEDFNPAPGTLLNFSLDSASDAIYLCSGDAEGNLTGYSHGVTFGGAALDVTFGRYVNSVGEEQFPPQINPTLGGPNAGPLIGPVVIQEILYHPELAEDEFVELRNNRAEDVPLFDPANPTHTWRLNGLGFDFPTNVVLPGQGLLLLVASSPPEFRARYNVPVSVAILGPFAGTLQDSGENLELQRPDAPDTNGFHYVTVDAVRYDDKAPWPPGADGGGPSLQRKSALAYGNDPVNWAAALPTPGVDFQAGQQAPLITAHPQSQTIVAYQDAVFQVTATGPAPLFYQWLFHGAPLPGATNDTLRLARVQPAQAGPYQVVVYNAAGSITSADAILTTLLPALIFEQPQNVTTNEGGAASFSVAALGTGPLRFRWRFAGVDLPDATNATLILPGVQASQDGLYTVVVTDDVGPIESDPARLTVLVPPVFIQGPQTLDVAPGATVVLSVTTTGTLPMGYRWRRGSASLTNMVLDSHTSFLTLVNVQSVDAGVYTVVATNAASHTPGLLSPRATLTVVMDTDGDGLPDDWESAHGMNPNDPGDGTEDSDGDGLTNWEEYVAGTDRLDAASYLKVDRLDSSNSVRIEFTAVADRTYTIEYSDYLAGGVWKKLADVAAQATGGGVTLLDPNPSPGRFYRLVTPRQP
jgi:CotH kinase protein/Lamin Tail Domain/Chitobiase/beta-hexosaminidase C-terminal domain/Concanavalin A-like lectin/glucanases superfamily/Immunoglobulin I-set domain/Bacterial TSP3 repeat